jgi:hypothetical protein
VATLTIVVSTINGPIRVRVASALINAVSTASAAVNLQWKVGYRFEILEDTLRGGEMGVEWVGIECEMFSNCECDIGPSCKCCIN